MGDEQADFLVYAFQVDCLYPINESERIKRFIEGHPHLVWPDFHKDLFVQGEDGGHCTVLDVRHPIHQWSETIWPDLRGRPVPRLITSGADYALRDILLMTHGGYPKSETIGRDYTSLFRRLAPEEMFVQSEDIFPAESDGVITPLAITTLSLKPASLGFGLNDAGFYSGLSDDFLDLVTFWNLRAAYVDVSFYDSRFGDRLRPSIENQTARLNARAKSALGGYPFHTTVWNRLERSSDDITPLGNSVSIRTVDKSWTWGRKKSWPAIVAFDDQAALGTIDSSASGSSQSVSIQLPDKPFDIQPNLMPQMLVASIWSYSQQSNRIICPPYTPKLNEYYGRRMYYRFDMVRSERGSLGIVIGETDTGVSLNILDGRKLIEQIFSAQSINAKPSDAGRVGLRLIEQMGGLQKCRVFKIPGVRELVRKYGPLKSLTRSEAIQTIRGLDPVSNETSFAPHEGLFITQREEKRRA